MAPNVPVVLDRLFYTLRVLKFRYHLFKKAKVVQYLKLSFGAIQR